MKFEVSIEERLLIYGLPESLIHDIGIALTVRVPATPDSEAIEKCLMTSEGYRLTGMPRGFLPALTEALTQLGHGCIATDRRTLYDPREFGSCKYAMRPHQDDAIAAILDKKEGVVVAPPAAGKTVLALEAIRQSKQRAIIIVDRLNILDQWKLRCEQFLGVTPAIINGTSPTITEGLTGVKDAPIVIGMQQSLNTINGLVKGFYNSFGFAVLDECHHVSANTYLDVLQRFNSTYRIGLSATPYRGDGLDLISKLVIGPVIYQISDTELIENKYIIKPSIEVVNTGFEHAFWGTHRTKAPFPCDKPNCPKSGTTHGHKNNYQNVTKALVEDTYRNHLIAAKVYQNFDCCNMIVSDRLGHLDTLRQRLIDMGFPKERTYMLTGKETPKQRAEVVRLAGYGACAIFSTIAKEALDIPRLDRLYMTWPIKREHILEQQIGRITRTHPDKREVICYDFVDEGCGVLASQAAGRFAYYNQKNYQIKQ